MDTTPPTDKRYAFYVDETMRTEYGYVPSIITEDEPDHTPMRGNGTHATPWYWGHDLMAARTIAAQANAALGLTDSDVRAVIMSSFRASQTIAETGLVIRFLVAGAITYEVESGDEPSAGWMLGPVTLADGTVLHRQDPVFAIVASAVEPYLSRIAWGAWGDRDADSVLRIDVRTGRWLRNP
ncbi:hypothetical protein [Winogradskya humida]|uniref:Uncharacterized protein n=1 Tax=Winogradskya humida TaxID=113566 RepID=A0ABQ4A1W1_9ACTN|nr:hypothetical protein [Actinoplanes humidus]GIE24828.1 hypothetical protein Ahu01nite_079300 [Actinoplanes humidus]